MKRIGLVFLLICFGGIFWLVHDTPQSETDIICERMEDIDFVARGFYVSDSYDAEMDQLFKNAFFLTISNQVPLQYGVDGAIYYRDLLRGVAQLSDQEFIEQDMKASDYFYLDFDGDGFPELIIQRSDGLYILKYIYEEERVIVYKTFIEGTKLLGTGQVYYYNPTSANRIVYGYTSINQAGNTDTEFTLEIYKENESENKEERIQYMISMDGYERINLSVEDWDRLTRDYFAILSQAPKPISFEAIFGERFCYTLEQSDDSDQAVKMYQDFLGGSRDIDGININDLLLESELDSETVIRYVLFDSNQDGVPDLHLEIGTNHYIFSYLKNQIYLWKKLENLNSERYYFLSDGNYVYMNTGEKGREFYRYFHMEPSTNEVGHIYFWRIDKNSDGIYDEEDEYGFADDYMDYMYADNTCTQEEWIERTRDYLYTDHNGEEQICNLMQWNVYETGN